MRSTTVLQQRLLETLSDRTFCRFPGVQAKDNFLSLLHLLIAKNPDNDLAAKMYYTDKFDLCESYSETDDLWNYALGCDPGMDRF